MVLKVDIPLTIFVSELNFVVNNNAVMLHSHHGRFFRGSCLKFDVISLPAEWRIAHVLVRSFPFVKASAFV